MVEAGLQVRPTNPEHIAAERLGPNFAA